MKRLSSSNWFPAVFAGLLAVTMVVLPGMSTAHASTPALGVPTFIGRAVVDVNAATAGWSKGVGTQFSPPVTSTQDVTFPGSGTVSVTLQQSFSVAGAPFIQVVSSDHPIGPWAAGATTSSGYLGYAVDDVQASGAALAAAGMQVTASSSSFAFYQGTDGVVVELVSRGLVPTAGTNSPQAAIDLGKPSHLDFYLCELDKVSDQLSAALGLTWLPPLVIPTPATFADGSTAIETFTVLESLQSGPPVYLEQPSPHSFPFACGPDSSTLRPEYTAPLGMLPQVKAQMERAGFALAAETGTNIGGVDVPTGDFFVGPSGFTIEITALL